MSVSPAQRVVTSIAVELAAYPAPLATHEHEYYIRSDDLVCDKYNPKNADWEVFICSGGQIETALRKAYLAGRKSAKKTKTKVKP